MSEELLQRGFDKKPEKFGKWDFYNIGSTTVRSLKSYGIIRSVDYGDVEGKKVDALIVNKKNVIAVIEYKLPKEFKTIKQKQVAIDQEIVVARKLGAKIIIATDSKESVWVNVLTGGFIKDEDGYNIKVNFDKDDEKLPSLIEKINYSINDTNDHVLPKELTDPTNLAKSIWQDIWSVSGATPENCLYTFIELFIFKYLSDLGILKGIFSFDNLMGLYADNSENEILKYYADTIRPQIKDLFPENTIDHTTIINGTIFVSKEQKAIDGYGTVFKKVLGRFRDYKKLEHIDYDFKSKLFESFMKESISKKNWGQFFTPMKVVRAIEQIARDEIKEGAVICDPACGVGKFLLEPIKSSLERFYKVDKSGVTPKITIRGFDKGFDKDEQKTIILAKANMLIYFSEIIKQNPAHTKDFARLFNESFTLKTTSILGTLQDPIENEYDLILTNPPYVTSGSSNLKDQIKKDGTLSSYYKINAMGVEGLFMEWIVRALKPGGKAFVVVPDGIFNRQNDKCLRQFLLDECFIDGIISLPLNTFFTTNKKTYVLCITKKNQRLEPQTTPIFTYLVSEIGESRDVYRFEIEQNDLAEAVMLYNFFKGNKNNFERMNRDPRCKVVQIEKFESASHWSIDRWWTKEEKIKLGIEEDNKAIDILNFSSIVSEISDTLGSFSSLLKEVGEKKKQIAESKSILLKDKNYFELFIGKRITKTELVNITGSLPIYSANVFTPLGYHHKSNIVDFSKSFVIWGIDGNFEFNFVPKDTQFVTTDHCGAIRILDDSILPAYLMIELENCKHKYGFDRGLRSSLKNMQPVEVFIPIDENGKFDIEAQQEIIEKYNVVTELKAKAKEYQEILDNAVVAINDECEYQEMAVSELFEVTKGSAKYTKLYGNTNKGQYPVYSASNLLPLTHIDTYDFDGKFLTWATNGFAGYIKVLNEKFSINGDRGLLFPKVKTINLDYVKFILEPILRSLAKGRKGDMGGDEFTKVYPSMVENVMISIPIDEHGNNDIKIQQEIADKYRKIEEIKKAISVELKRLQNTSVSL
ncbi:MAG: N-6 DNA methylase [Desulfamplus sp.]|nr:N-6 DNA methylase [Desulfamplus sp.]